MTKIEPGANFRHYTYILAFFKLIFYFNHLKFFKNLHE